MDTPKNYKEKTLQPKQLFSDRKAFRKLIVDVS